MIARRALLRGLACTVVLALSGISWGQYTSTRNYGNTEFWGIIGEAFGETVTTGITIPPPQVVYWHESNGPLPAGLTVTEFDVSGFGDRGIRIEGTPTSPGFHTCLLGYATCRISGTGTVTLILFRNADDRDTAAYYTNLMTESSGPDHFYWAALRGYAIGIGVEDERLALYSSYTSLVTTATFPTRRVLHSTPRTTTGTTAAWRRITTKTGMATRRRPRAGSPAT